MGIDGLEGPHLPGLEIVDHALGHGRDEHGRDLGAVKLLQVGLDVAGGQAPGIERDHLVVETRQTPLALLHQLQLEGTGAVARHLERQAASVGQHGLRAAAIARVVARILGALVRVVIQVRGELGGERTLDHALGHLLDQPLFAENLFGCLAFEQLIEQTVLFWVTSLISLAIADSPLVDLTMTSYTDQITEPKPAQIQNPAFMSVVRPSSSVVPAGYILGASITTQTATRLRRTELHLQ